MSLSVYGLLSGSKELFELDGHYPVGLFKLADQGSKDAILISFVDVSTAAGSSDWLWLGRLQTLQAAHGSSNVLIVAVLYDSAGGFNWTTLENTLNTRGYRTQPGAGTLLNYTLLKDTTWAGSASQQYYNAFGGAVTKPYSFVICPYLDAGNFLFRVTDRWHTASADNGDGLAASFSNLASAETWASARLLDHRTVPTITAALAAGQANPTDDGTISVDLSATNEPTPELRVRWLLKEDSAAPHCLDPRFQSTKPSTFVLSGTDGTKTVYVWARDDAANLSAVASFSIRLDTTAPGIVMFELDSDAETGNSTIDYTLRGDSETQKWCVKETAAAPGALDWNDLPYQSSHATTASNQTVTLYAWVRDEAGNPSGSAQISAFIDKIAPGSVKDLDTDPTGVTLTRQASVPCTLGATHAAGAAGAPPSGNVYYLVKENATTPLASDAGWTLLPAVDAVTGRASITVQLSAGDATKNLYAWVRDTAGNIVAAGSISIELDTKAPGIVAFDLRSDAETNDGTIAYTLQGDSDTYQWCVKETAAQPAAGDWNNLPYQSSYVTAASNQTVILYAWVRDEAGNESGSAQISAFIDKAPPANVQNLAKVPGGMTTTKEATLPCTLGATHAAGAAGAPPSGNVYYLVKEDATTPLASDAGWSLLPAVDAVTHRASITVQLSVGDGTKNLHAWVRDTAGNIVAAGSVSVIRDSTVPTVVSVDPAPDAAGFVNGKRLSALSQIVVTFSEDMDPTAATASAYYELLPAGYGLTVGAVAGAGRVFTVSIVGTPPDADVTFRLKSGLTDQAGNPLTQTDFVYAMQKPTDAVLVLDFSGSMNTDVTLDSTVQPKADYLRSSASALLTIWQEYATNGDRVEIVYFSTNAAVRGDLPANQAFLSIASRDNRNILIEDIRAHPVGGCTAMGGAIATALDLLGRPAAGVPQLRNRRVILFTDGLQNRNPVVETAPGGGYEIRNNAPSDSPPGHDYPWGWTCLGSQPSTYAGALPLPLGSIAPVHSVEILEETSSSGYLGSLSAATGGIHTNESAIWPYLDDGFVDSLVDCIRGGSVQVVARFRSSCPAGQDTVRHAFSLNAGVTKASVFVGWVGDNSPTITVHKDGKQVPLAQSSRADERFYLGSIRFGAARGIVALSAVPTLGHAVRILEERVLGSLASPQPEGTWELTIRWDKPSDSPISYHVIILADEHALRCELEYPVGIALCGTPVLLGLRMLQAGKPLEITRAQLTVRSPRTLPGELFDKYPVSDPAAQAKKLSAANPDRYGSATIARKAMLLANPKAAAALRARTEQTLVLKPVPSAAPQRLRSGAGLHAVELTPSRPGPHTLCFTVAGTTSGGSRFERTESRTMWVYALPALKGLSARGQYLPKEQCAVVTIRARDDAGRLLLGYLTEIVKVTSPAGKRITMRELFEGEIEVSIGGISDQKAWAKTPIEITAMSRTVYRGPIDGLPGFTGSPKRASTGAKKVARKPASTKKD